MWNHFGYHLAGSIVLGGVLFWSRSWTKPADELARRLRWALLGALSLSLIAQTLEAIGAFGDTENGSRNSLDSFHDLGVIVGPVAILLLIFALVATGALALANHFSFRETRWFGAALGVAALAAAAFVVGAFVFGY